MAPSRAWSPAVVVALNDMSAREFMKSQTTVCLQEKIGEKIDNIVRGNAVVFITEAPDRQDEYVCDDCRRQHEAHKHHHPHSRLHGR